MPRRSEIVGDDLRTEALRERQAAVVRIAASRSCLLLGERGRSSGDHKDCHTHFSHIAKL
jgi:hypothetical protein